MAADGTRIVLLQPRGDALRVKRMPTRHKQTIHPQPQLVLANYTLRALQLPLFIPLAMRLIYFNYWQLTHCLLTCWGLLMSLLL